MPPGERNPGSGRCSACRRDPGHDLISDPGFAQRSHFFLQSADYPGIAGLEPHNACARQCILGEEAAHMILPRGREPGPFADAYQIGPPARMFENGPGSEVVIEYDIGRLQPGSALQRQQLWIAGT
jgi:hypothetical protein